MSGYHKKRTPPKRWCNDCGAYVGRHFSEFVLCTPCKKGGLARAAARTAERNERHGRVSGLPAPRMMDDIPY
jgi:hypothetical protein